MRSVNKVILIGNLTRDPEMKSTSSGQSLVTFGMATNRQWTTSNGEKKSSAEFHECSVWSNLAEICHRYLKKGMLVYVEGYLKTRSWDREDGTKAHRTEIVVGDMIMLERRGENDEDYEPSMGSNMGDDDDYGDDSGAGDDNATTGGSAGDDSSMGAAAVSDDSSDAGETSPGEITADLEDDNMF